MGVGPPATATGATVSRSATSIANALARQELAAEAARREGLDERLLISVMETESGFRPCAVSPKGALGLMQLMPATALEWGVSDPLDPRANVIAGARYLKQLLNRYGGNLMLALSAYNAGPARVDNAGGVPSIRETLDYLRKVVPFIPVRQ